MKKTIQKLIFYYMSAQNYVHMELYLSIVEQSGEFRNSNGIMNFEKSAKSVLSLLQWPLQQMPVT